eukprot:8864360-Pyramimonas_sp.AAC.3
MISLVQVQSAPRVFVRRDAVTTCSRDGLGLGFGVGHLFRQSSRDVLRKQCGFCLSSKRIHRARAQPLAATSSTPTDGGGRRAASADARRAGKRRTVEDLEVGSTVELYCHGLAFG